MDLNKGFIKNVSKFGPLLLLFAISDIYLIFALDFGRRERLVPFFYSSQIKTLQSNKLNRYVDDCLNANGWNDCFIVDIITSPSGKIQVYLDSDNAVSFEICRKVSRHIESIIDETKEFGEKYTLEVSSPGLSRPLKFLRQYKKNVGRKVAIKTKEKTFKGILKEVEEDFVVIVEKKSVKGSKKKIDKENRIEMIEILETKIAVSF